MGLRRPNWTSKAFLFEVTKLFFNQTFRWNSRREFERLFSRQPKATTSYNSQRPRGQQRARGNGLVRRDSKSRTAKVETRLESTVFGEKNFLSLVKGFLKFLVRNRIRPLWDRRLHPRPRVLARRPRKSAKSRGEEAATQTFCACHPRTKGNFSNTCKVST